jgi:hypothetical protein
METDRELVINQSHLLTDSHINHLVVLSLPRGRDFLQVFNYRLVKRFPKDHM